jgi:hypothetical protein
MRHANPGRKGAPACRITSLPGAPLDDRTHWLTEIRRAVRSDGDADLRALVILAATRSLGELPATANEALTLRIMSRVALTMAGLNQHDLRRLDVLSDLAKAWMAFESTWYDEQGRPFGADGKERSAASRR